MTLWILVFLPSVIGILIAFLPVGEKSSPKTRITDRLLLILPIVPALLFIGLVLNISNIYHGEVFRTSYQWVEALGLELSFVLDGLSLLFALIITGIGALIVLYSNSYFYDMGDRKRFLSTLFVFMTAMLGIVMSGNLLGMFVFWEGTTITSYLLIGFKHQDEAARLGARKALIVTGGGGLALLGGIALIGVMSGGIYDFATLDGMRNGLVSHRLFDFALVLILIGAFTKSAQFPFHFWLPGAMEAPTPASSYLHSATMVKAGIYLLARLSHTFGDTDLWLYSLVGIGLFTFVYGAFMALTVRDLKAILAYSTVSWLGVLVALIGLNTKDSLKAVVIGILAHALYKGALFLVAGAVDHETGTRDIAKLGGLARKMPQTTTAASLVLLSMAGIPPMIGFVAKETLKLAATANNIPAEFVTLFPVAAVLGSALTVAAAVVIARETFFGAEPPEGYEKSVHEAPMPMWGGPMLLGILSLILALFLHELIEPLIVPALSAMTGKSSEIDLHLIPKLDDIAFQLSMVAIVLGIIIGFAGPLIRRATQSRPLLNPTQAYELIFGNGSEANPTRSLLDWGYKLVDSTLQNGILRFYLGIVLVSFVVIVWGTIGLVVSEGNLEMIHIGDDLRHVTFVEATFALVAVVGAIQTVRAKSRLEAVVWAGITGSQTTVLFVFFGAPDLALTQLLIEVLSLLLLMIAFRLLPKFMQDTSRLTEARTLRDISIAVGVGFTMTIVTLLVKANQTSPSIRGYFEKNAYELGRGHNIVNVILVDFRGIDTLGEVTVLVIAALGVLALVLPMPLLDLMDRDKDEQPIEDDSIFAENEKRDESILVHIYSRVNLLLEANIRSLTRNNEKSADIKNEKENL